MRDNQKRMAAQTPELQSAPPASPGGLSFVVPTEFVVLPSRGKFYPADHPLHNKETIEIKKLGGLLLLLPDTIFTANAVSGGSFFKKFAYPLLDKTFGLVLKNLDFIPIFISDSSMEKEFPTSSPII